MYFYRIDSSAVEALETFPLTCGVENMQVSCNTESTTLPGRTRCRIDNDDDFICE